MKGLEGGSKISLLSPISASGFGAGSDDRDYGKGRTSVGSFRLPTGHPVDPLSD